MPGSSQPNSMSFFAGAPAWAGVFRRTCARGSRLRYRASSSGKSAGIR